MLKELQRLLPLESFVYLGDTARTPYGSKGRETIVRYSHECAAFITEAGIKLLVVACNTSSAYALDDLSSELSVPVLGTIAPAVEAAAGATRSGRVGVIATEATIASGVFADEFSRQHSLNIVSKACPLFVPLVEQGMYDGDIVEKVVELYLTELREFEIDTLVLGCTHYPLLRRVISEFMGEQVQIVECSTALAEQAKSLLASRGMLAQVRGMPDSYYVTDHLSRFNRLAAALFKDEAVSVLRVDL